MIRSYIKSAAADVVSWTRLDAVISANRHRRLPFVVAYHRVVERLNQHRDFALPAMEISTATLEKHLDWLARRFRIISLDHLPIELERPRGSKPIAAVTFDDGYRDVFEHGFPLLKRKGIPAAFFVVTDLVGTRNLPAHERLYAAIKESWPVNFISRTARDPFSATQSLLKQLSHDEIQRLIEQLEEHTNRSHLPPAALEPMNWEMVATLRDAGMTIGSHSRTHACLTNETAVRIHEEAAASRRALEEKLGVTVRCFAYPGGVFNSNVVDAIEAAGYQYSFTICRHRDPRRPLLTIPRRMLWEGSCLKPTGTFSQAIMSCHAAGAFDWTSRCAPAHAA